MRSARAQNFISRPPVALPESIWKPSESARRTIDKWLAHEMEIAARNGANSISMPDDLVEIARWLMDAEQPEGAKGKVIRRDY